MLYLISKYPTKINLCGFKEESDFEVPAKTNRDPSTRQHEQPTYSFQFQLLSIRVKKIEGTCKKCLLLLYLQKDATQK